MEGVEVRRVGLGGWLVEVPSAEAVASLHRHLSARDSPAGVEDLVAGARTVFIDGHLTRSAVDELVAGWDPIATFGGGEQRTVEVEVRYDGPDLDDVARAVGWTRSAVVAAHTGSVMSVAFCGFAPGFAYIAGLPPPLRLPRLAQPRTAVPLGAVAIAEEYTGIYPRRSPGGWRLIGHTDAPLWDVGREPPALLTPGTTVRFVSVT